MGTDGERDQNESPNEISVDEILKSFGINKAVEMYPMFMEYMHLVSEGKTPSEIAKVIFSSENCNDNFIIFYAMIGLANVLDTYMKEINGVPVMNALKEATEMLDVKKLNN